MIELLAVTIAGVFSLIAAYFARQGSTRVKTSNGHSLGELVETIDQRITHHTELDDLRFEQINIRLDAMARSAGVHHAEATSEAKKDVDRHPVL